MPRILTVLLHLHWAMAFAVLAFLSLSGSGEGAAEAFASLGIALPQKTIGGPVAAGFVALGSVLCALLFLWSLVAALFANAEECETDEVAIVAFAFAAGFLSLMLVTGIAGGATGAMQAVSIQLGALLASFIAIGAAQRSAATTVTAGRLAVRALAIDASRMASPIRLAFGDGASRSKER